MRTDSAGTVALQNLVDRFGGQRAEPIAVHHHHRREVTRRQALRLAEGEYPVRRDLPGRDLQTRFQVVADVLGPVQRAGQVRAQEDEVPPRRFEEEEPVEGGDGGDLAQREVEQVGHLAEGRHQRSTSPRMMSMLAIATTTSAMYPRKIITGSACRLQSEGVRMCTRAGRLLPSLTM